MFLLSSCELHSVNCPNWLFVGRFFVCFGRLFSNCRVVFSNQNISVISSNQNIGYFLFYITVSLQHVTKQPGVVSSFQTSIPLFQMSHLYACFINFQTLVHHCARYSLCNKIAWTDSRLDNGMNLVWIFFICCHIQSFFSNFCTSQCQRLVVGSSNRSLSARCSL